MTLATPRNVAVLVGSLRKEQGKLTNDSTCEFPEQLIAAFEKWIERNAAGANAAPA